MLAVISPAKRLNFEDKSYKGPATSPMFKKDTMLLVSRAQKLSRKKIKDLMGLSDQLAKLNHERFQAFAEKPAPSKSKVAILAFKGDTYIGLKADSFDAEDLKFAQDHLRILSGLYGVLRPLDRIQPYRLEMGSNLKNKRGENLYDFWGGQLAPQIEEEIDGHEHPVVINLASNEYFKALKPGLEAKVITPGFKEIKDGETRMLGAFAKQARGMMVRYMIDNRVTDPEDLKKFDYGDYAYQEDLSDETDWVFTRQQPPPPR